MDKNILKFECGYKDFEEFKKDRILKFNDGFECISMKEYPYKNPVYKIIAKYENKNVINWRQY